MDTESSSGETFLSSLVATRLPMRRTSLVCVSFRKENDKHVPAGSQHNDTCERRFSRIAHASSRHLFITEQTYALLR
jgi:hypothetical protein